MENPRQSVSVVIPVRNRGHLICTAVESALRQTRPPDEIIIVDDASDDATVAMVAALQDPRIRIVRLPRKSGAQAARNAGIREARSSWVAFLDSDDVWVPEKLERQFQVLAEVGFDPWTLVYSNGVAIDTVHRTRDPDFVLVVEGDRPYADALQRSGPLFQSMLVSKTALAAIGYLDENVPAFQEWDTSIRLAKLCRFVHIDERLFEYYRHGGERVSKDRMRAVAGYRYITDKFENDIRSICGESAWQEHLFHRALLSLDAALWLQADTDLRRLSGAERRYWFLRFCRLFRLSPSGLLRLKKTVDFRQKRGRDLDGAND